MFLKNHPLQAGGIRSFNETPIDHWFLVLRNFSLSKPIASKACRQSETVAEAKPSAARKTEVFRWWKISDILIRGNFVHIRAFFPKSLNIPFP